jgi:hypothetical protein
MHPSQKPRFADTTHQRCSLGSSLSTTPITGSVVDWQQKENPTYVLLFADLGKPCLWDRPNPMEKASQIRSEKRMVRKSIGEMISGKYLTRIETVAVSVFGMVHTHKE